MSVHPDGIGITSRYAKGPRRLMITVRRRWIRARTRRSGQEMVPNPPQRSSKITRRITSSSDQYGSRLFIMASLTGYVTLCAKSSAAGRTRTTMTTARSGRQGHGGLSARAQRQVGYRICTCAVENRNIFDFHAIPQGYDVGMLLSMDPLSKREAIVHGCQAARHVEQ